MGFGRVAVLQPVERRRCPGIVALEADFAGSDWPRCWRRLNRYRLFAGQDTVPELFLRLQELELVEPVGGDLDDLILVVAEDDRENCPFRPGHRHVVLELGHVALENFLALRERAGVLGLPDRAGSRLRRPACSGANSLRAGEDLANSLYPLARQPLEPLAVERLGPAAEHHRKHWRESSGWLRPAFRATSGGPSRHRRTGSYWRRCRR